MVLCYTDQWNSQATVMRINESLIERGYVTWFDLTNMKGITSALAAASVAFHCGIAADQPETRTGGDAGSTVDAMSDAIERADVMLYGVSLAYKESANVSALNNLGVLEIYPVSYCLVYRSAGCHVV